MQLSEKLLAEANVGDFATIIDTANIKSISKEARDWYSQVPERQPAQRERGFNRKFILLPESLLTSFLGFKNSRTEMKIFNEKDVGC